MKRVLATLVIAVSMVLAGGSVASANGTCDSGHGAFGAFSHHFAAYDGVNWISADAKADGGMGHETGPANSGLSASCNGN